METDINPMGYVCEVIKRQGRCEGCLMYIKAEDFCEWENETYHAKCAGKASASKALGKEGES